MADGDPQQSNEIQGAIMDYFKNAVRGSCGWHIVDRGWKEHGPGNNSVTVKNRAKFQRFIRHIHTWMYSWMRPGYCETQEEYELSKQMLFAYLGSETALNICEEQYHVIEKIKDFIHSHLFSMITFFFTTRKKI